MQDKGAYNGHFLLTLDENIDMNRLAAAIEKAVAAPPSIFVRVTEKDGEPYQEFSAEDYNQTVEQMSEAAWQKNCPKLSLSLLNFTAADYSVLIWCRPKRRNIFCAQLITFALTVQRLMFSLLTWQKLMPTPTPNLRRKL